MSVGQQPLLFFKPSELKVQSHGWSFCKCCNRAALLCCVIAHSAHVITACSRKHNSLLNLLHFVPFKGNDFIFRVPAISSGSTLSSDSQLLAAPLTTALCTDAWTGLTLFLRWVISTGRWECFLATRPAELKQWSGVQWCLTEEKAQIQLNTIEYNCSIRLWFCLFLYSNLFPSFHLHPIYILLHFVPMLPLFISILKFHYNTIQFKWTVLYCFLLYLQWIYWQIL